MKLHVLLSFFLFAFTAGAQSLSWFHGDWTGETYFPNGPITRRIIVKLHVVKITGSRFDATLSNLYPSDTTVRLEKTITGSIINKKLVIESSRQTYIRDPRTQNFWHDCSDCEIQSDFSINSDRVEIKIKTVNCGDECDGETLFSRDTSDLNPEQKTDLTKWLHLSPTKPEIKTGKKTTKDSSVLAPKTSAPTIKADTLHKQKITEKDTAAAIQKAPVSRESPVSKKLQKDTLPVKQKQIKKDTLIAISAKPLQVKKDSLIRSDIPKADSTPSALTSRTTNLVTTYQVASPHIVIQLFDNAEIDGDVVTVYHNGQLIVNRQSLTHKAITITINASKKDAHHEFILVADNLGLIPPNTALMRITAGEQKFELEVSSDFDNNSKIAIDYTGE